MRVLVGAFGTRGDVQPMLALSRSLEARGHAVRLAVPPNSMALARDAGFEAIPVGLDYEDISRRAATGSIRELLTLIPLLREEVRTQIGALEQHTAGVDLVVGSSVFAVGAVFAEVLRKPYVYFAFCPQLLASSDHPSPAVPWHGMPHWANRATWAFNGWYWSRLLRTLMNEVRAERKLGPIGDVWSSLTGAHPILASDPVLAAAPADHPVPVAQPGAMFLADSGGLSPGLSSFLEAGPAPAYVGFGSMSDPSPRKTTERILEAVRRAGVRAVISRGWARLVASAAPDGVLFIGPEPHDKLFPRCAAVVHHGGAGTTHAAARAGVPQVVLPQLLDQHYWAHRVRALGLGRADVPRHGRNPEPLARALRACHGDAALIARARAFAGTMRQDGAERAAELLERISERGESAT